MIKLIQEFLEFRKQKEQRKVSCKRFMIIQAMIKYYQDLQDARGDVDLPPCILALNATKELKTNRQINRMYHKLELAGLV